MDKQPRGQSSGTDLDDPYADEPGQVRRARIPGKLVRAVLLVGVLGFLAWYGLDQWDRDHPVAVWSRALASTDAATRLAAIKGIEECARDDAEEAINALLPALQDPDAAVRAAAATALVTPIAATDDSSRIGNVKRVVAALENCLNDQVPEVRAAAARSIGSVTTLGRASARDVDLGEAAKRLVERLNDDDPSVRLAAIHGLAAVGPKTRDDPPTALVAALDDPIAKNSEAAVRAVVEFRAGLTGILPELVLRLERASPQYRAAIAKLLSHVRPPQFTTDAVPALVQSLRSADPAITRQAVASLSAFASAGADHPRSLRSNSWERAGIGTISNLAMPELAATLDRLATAKGTHANPPDPDRAPVMIAIIRCLERLAPFATSCEPALEVLIRFAREAVDTQSRTAAVNALGKFRPTPRLFTILTELIDDRDIEVRICAMLAIDQADFHEGYTVPRSLAAAIEDPSPRVRDAAAAAMGHAGLGLDPFIPILVRHAQHDDDSEVRACCRTVIGICAVPPKITPACVPELIPALAIPDPQIRENVALALSRLGPAAAPAIPALLVALKNPALKENSFDRDWIAFALSRIAPSTPLAGTVVAALTELFDDPSWRPDPRAIHAIAAFGPKAAPAVTRLVDLRQHDNPLVREAAAETLAKIQSGR